MSRLNKDVLSGALFIVVGAVGLWLGQDYAMGTPFRMGPGYFPRLLCWSLLIVGSLILLKGALAGGEAPEKLHWRPVVMITLAVLAFAGLIATAGLLPAAAAVVFLGAVGGPEFRWIEGVILAAVLSAAAIALFKYGLSMTMPIINI